MCVNCYSILLNYFRFWFIRSWEGTDTPHFIELHFIQFSSVTKSCLTLFNPMNHSTPSLPVYHQLPEFTQTHVHWVGDAIQPSHPPAISYSVVPFFSCLQPLPASGSFPMSQLFSWGGQSIFSLSISPSSEDPGLVSFRMDWLDLLTVQGTLKSLLQHLSSKASILWLSAFFTVQLSHPYMTTGKTIALTRQTFVGKIMSLLFNMLSRLVITFLPRSKRLSISWLQSPSIVILEPPKNSLTLFPLSPHLFLMKWWDQMPWS